MRLRWFVAALTVLALVVGGALLATGYDGGESSDSASSSDAGSTTAQVDEDQVSSEPESAPLSEGGWLLSFQLPVDVDSLYSELGEPDSVELPAADDPSPWGQWLRWSVSGGDYTFTANTDSYVPESVARDAMVVATELRANTSTETDEEVVHGLPMGAAMADAQTALGGALVQSDLANRSEIDPDDVYGDSLKYVEPDRYTFFMFDHENRLKGVVVATFDIGNVD